MNAPRIELFTIGHSNQPLEQFLSLLERHQIMALADIRRFPGSRKFPHFSQESLSRALPEAGIEYHWIERLGGRRTRAAAEASPNTALRNQSFRNYADYMMTDEFRRGFEEVAALARSKRTAIMCSESVFWRCHRRLVSDYAVASGGRVHHIFPSGDTKPHAMTAEARVLAEGLRYPLQQPLFDPPEAPEQRSSD